MRKEKFFLKLKLKGYEKKILKINAHFPKLNNHQIYVDVTRVILPTQAKLLTNDNNSM